MILSRVHRERVCGQQKTEGNEFLQESAQERGLQYEGNIQQVHLYCMNNVYDV